MLPTERRSPDAAEIVGGSRIAVLVPCYNEEAAIGKVVADFRAALPEAAIYVYDNNSTDRTVEAARAGRRGGARASRTRARATWCGACSPTSRPTSTCWSTATRPTTRRARAAMIAQAGAPSGSTWWCAVRVDREEAAYRPGHRAGNRLLTGFVAHVFGAAFTDMLSGYRVFSRRFVKSFPVLSGGFEIETELTVHALELELPVGEMQTPYYARPEGSASKLNTWRDGFRILWTILQLYRAERPLPLFSAHRRYRLPSSSIGLAIPIFVTYLAEGHWCRGCRPRCCRPA